MAVGASLAAPGGRNGGGRDDSLARLAHEPVGPVEHFLAGREDDPNDHRRSASNHPHEVGRRSSEHEQLLGNTASHAFGHRLSAVSHGSSAAAHHAFTNRATSGRSSLRAGFVFFCRAARVFRSEAPSTGSPAFTWTVPTFYSPVERCTSASARCAGSKIMTTAAHLGRESDQSLSPILVAARESTVASAMFGIQAAPKPLHCNPLMGLHRRREEEHHGSSLSHADEDQEVAQDRGEWHRPGLPKLVDERRRAPDDCGNSGAGQSSTSVFSTAKSHQKMRGRASNDAVPESPFLGHLSGKSSTFAPTNAR